MSIIFILGVICGVAIVAILSVILCKWMRKDGGKKVILDERQQRARGEAFKYGFFTCLILNAVYACVSTFVEIKSTNTFIIMAAIIIISVVIYAVYCIMQDAYVGINENPKRMIIVFFVIGLFNLAIVVVQMMHGEEKLIENGDVATWSMNILCAIMMFIIAAAYILHQKAEKE